MGEKKVPKATLQRYPVYLKALRKLHADGINRIMSRELADYVSIESTTIRRDFSFLGNLGKQGYGYNVEDLISIFSNQLGVNFDEKIILVGAGNLGDDVFVGDGEDPVPLVAPLVLALVEVDAQGASLGAIVRHLL